ncbi:UNVERIFIED_CONTAM: hypothetical protein GTU68_005389 [Idotea baltica]|nr:hypothetical protein [Idotea baltica]
MERIGFKMKLHPGMEAEYKKRHDEIWPELSELLAAYGIRNYVIFHDPETNILFATFQKTDANRLDELADAPVMKKWWAFMGDIMDTNPDTSPVQKPLDCVFDLD